MSPEQNTRRVHACADWRVRGRDGGGGGGRGGGGDTRLPGQALGGSLGRRAERHGTETACVMKDMELKDTKRDERCKRN